MKKNIQIFIFVILCGTFILMSLIQMDVFPNKFERMILNISFEGTITEVRVEKMHRVIILDSNLKVYMPRMSNFRMIDDSLKGKKIHKRRNSYKLKIAENTLDEIILEYPTTESSYTMELVNYGYNN